ncbi:MAG: DNA internalization-related competence protein ComEC/Rec2 [Pseudomonadales bacterium]|nr:DNA internalization-related competence protein ComEC/Rec2 [Pseudomonadales bacterium]
MIAFCIGVVSAAWLPHLPSATWLLWLALPLPLLFRYRVLRVPGALLLGVWWLAWQGRQTLDEWWPVTSAPSEVWAEGVVWRLPVNTAQGQRVVFKLERLCAAAALSDCEAGGWQRDARLLQLSTYEPLTLAPGQRWRWQVRLRRPHGFANPGAYDYEAWLLQQRIAALGYVRDTHSAVLLEENSGSQILERLRHDLLQRLNHAGTGLKQLPYIIALTLGDGSGIDADAWALFNRTGTTHLMVISGSHITLAAGLCLWLLRRLWCLSARLPLLWPAPFAAALAGLGGAWFYTALAGFNLPAQRALLMSLLSLGAILLRRQTGLWQGLLTALALVLAVDPLAPQLPGFWLSFIAVAMLTLAVLRDAGGKAWWHGAWRLLRSQGYISVALLPLMGLLFQQVSWSAPLCNLLAIPCIELVATPLSLLCLLLATLSPTLATPLLQLTDTLLAWYLAGLRGFDAAVPEPLWTLPWLSLLGRVLLIALVVALLLSRRWWLRLTWLAALPAVLLLREPRLPPGVVSLSVLDVGQGAAIVVRTREHQLLYDTGPRYSEQLDAGSAAVLPVLRFHGIKQLDRVIVSHADLDHAGGIDAVLAQYTQALYQTSEPGMFPARVSQQLCRAGQQWQWDGIVFDLLSPDEHPGSRNNGSCVLRIRAGTQVALLTGDIERAREHQLLAQGLSGPLTLLVAPHHGSATSSSPAFLNALRPAHVVFTTGYLNRYHHPAPAVVARYEKAGAQTWYTLRSGALTFTLDSQTATPAITQQRLLRPRFWGEPLP